MDRKDLKITRARLVANNKLELQFEQAIQRDGARPQSILGLMNKSDDAFTTNGNYHCWYNGPTADVAALFGVDAEGLVNVKDEKELNIVNPKVQDQDINLQITEVTEDYFNDYEKDNASAWKSRGANGELIKHKGKKIAIRTDVVLGAPKHIFLEADAPVTVAAQPVVAPVSAEVEV